MKFSGYPSTQPLDVVVVGAVAMDMLAWVDELPGKDSIVLARQVELRPGGSGANVAVATARLGFKVGFIAKMSPDEHGRRLLEEFSKEGVDTLACRLDPDQPTAICFIAINEHGERSMVALGGAGPIQSHDDIDFEYLSRTRLCYVTEVKPQILQVIAECIRQKGGQVVFSPGGIASSRGLEPFERLLSLVDVLLLSKTESESLLPDLSVDLAAQRLCALGARNVVITQGSQGVTFRGPDQAFHLPALPVREIIDTTGAGDAFAGGLLAGMLLKKPIKAAIQYGNAAAALKVGHAGARGGLPVREQLEKFLLDNYIML